MSAFAGTFSDLKLVKTRGVAQVIVEIPIEHFSSFVAHFGAPNGDTWVGIAKINGQPRGMMDSPGPAEKDRTEGAAAVKAAALRCKDEPFQRWLLGTLYNPQDPAWNELETINQLRLQLDVKSRAEIGDSPEKLADWRALCRIYERERKATQESK